MKSILSKLLLSHFVVIAVPLLAFGIFGLMSIENAIKSQFEKNWQSHIEALGAELGARMRRGDDFKTASANIEENAALAPGVKLNVFDTGGTQLVFSSNDVLADASEALEGRFSKSYCYVDKGKGFESGWVLSIAMPAKLVSGEVIGALHLVVNADSVMMEINGVRVKIILTLVVAALFSAFIALLFSKQFTRPLIDLTAYAEKVADGKRQGSGRFPGGADVPVVKTKDEIATLAAAFKQMTEKLQERMDYIRDFAQSLTHELKTPLTSIIGAAEILTDGAMDNPDDRAKFIGNINSECLHLRSIVEDILALAKLESEAVPFQASEADWNEFIRSVVQSHRHLADDKGINFNFEPADGEIKAVFDSWRMEQVIVNLLSNAAKFTPKGGEITVATALSGDRAVLTVTDTGEGIAEEDLPLVFNRFFTRPVSDMGDDSPKGTGLGLAIVKEIVDAHNGTVSAESEQGKSSAFTVEIPLQNDVTT